MENSGTEKGKEEGNRVERILKRGERGEKREKRKRNKKKGNRFRSIEMEETVKGWKIERRREEKR